MPFTNLPLAAKQLLDTSSAKHSLKDYYQDLKLIDPKNSTEIYNFSEKTILVQTFRITVNYNAFEVNWLLKQKDISLKFLDIKTV